jgi:D-alanyl-D-alanine dipeptidase
METESLFGPLEAQRGRPIPDQEPDIARRRGYRSHPLDLSDPRAQEPLVPVAGAGVSGANHYFEACNPPYYRRIPGATPHLLVRRGALERLAVVNRRLAASGLELFVFDGWRPRAVQAYFHDRWMPERILAAFPGLASDEVTRKVEQYWSDPTVDAASPAPHSTGGAVDLTLRWAGSLQPLWMGSLFDDVSEIAHLDHFERRRDAGLALSDDEARKNRRLLYWLMTEAGFAANPTEWWHYGYGELMWARLTGAPAAFYGDASAQVEA